MKKLIGLLGFVVGLCLGVGLLMINPVTFLHPAPVTLAGVVRALDWQGGSGARGYAATPAALLGFGQSSARFSDAAIRHARIDVMALSDDLGAPVALGVRLSALAAANSLIQARLGTTAHWNVVWPGQGSALLSGSENLWSPVRDGLWSAVRGRGWRPARERYLLAPIAGLGAGAVVAATGAFANTTGTFREQFLPLERAPGDLIGDRQLQLVME
jgi:hypothetical protein